MFTRIFIVVSIVAMSACASTVTKTLPDGTTYKAPATLVAIENQTEFAERAADDSACNIPAPVLPDGTGDMAIAFAMDSWGDAVESCNRDRKDNLAALKPDSYAKYELARNKMYLGGVLRGGGLLMQALCMFNAFGACGGNSNSSGDNYENINITQTGAPGGSGGVGGGGETGAGGAGGAGAGSGDMGISIGGYGNTMNSTTSGISGYGVSGDLFNNNADLNFGSLQNGSTDEGSFDGTIDDQSDNAGF